MSWAYAETLSAPLLRRSPLTATLVLVSSGALLVALCAQVSVPLPFTPVPITGQTFAVLLVASACGPLLGCASITLYVLLGSLGVPVYADGASGVEVLTGATGGYLLGFIAASVVVGMLAEEAGWDRRFGTATASMLAGNVVVYLFGLPLLALELGTGLEKTLQLGLYPFVVGDLAKLYLAALVLPAAWRLARTRSR